MYHMYAGPVLVLHSTLVLYSSSFNSLLQHSIQLKKSSVSVTCHFTDALAVHRDIPKSFVSGSMKGSRPS